MLSTLLQEKGRELFTISRPIQSLITLNFLMDTAMPFSSQSDEQMLQCERRELLHINIGVSALIAK